MATRLSGNSARKKNHRNGGAVAVERLSSLQQSILRHILSLLPTTKDAVKTGALSKSWQFLWTSVPTLVFFPSLRPDFAQSIEKTLILHFAPTITEFLISFPYHDSLKSRIDYWVRFTIVRPVEHLHIDFLTVFGIAEYLLPRFLYNHPDLTKLIIRYCIICPQEIFHLPSLTDVSLLDAQFSDVAVAKLLSGCPSLQSLKSCFCSGFRDLKIHSASLKRLTFQFYDFDSRMEFARK